MELYGLYLFHKFLGETLFKVCWTTKLVLLKSCLKLNMNLLSYLSELVSFEVIFESKKMASNEYVPLFETERGKGRFIYRLFAMSVFVGICFILVYRVSHIPRAGKDVRWSWIGLFGAEIWFALYWVCSQALRWNCVYRRTFKERLSQRSLSFSVGEIYMLLVLERI